MTCNRCGRAMFEATDTETEATVELDQKPWRRWVFHDKARTEALEIDTFARHRCKGP